MPAAARSCFLLIATLVVTTLASGQTAFEVAAIRPSQQSVEFERDGETKVVGDRLSMRDVTLSTCVKWAYQVQQAQIIGPYHWDQQHYDVTAKADPGTSEETMRLMLQALLAERFHLVFHREKRELAAYAIEVDPKGLKIKPSPDSEGALYRQNSATGMVARNITMQQLADYISGPLGAPLADDTHLPGKYNLNLDFTGYVDEDRDHQAGPASILNAAFRGNLGLQLVRRKSIFDVMVIDHVESPTPN
jgi:uncharacterized protein (TIGR03435 family)